MNTKPFVNFVLLDSKEWNPQKLIADLSEDWQYQVESFDEENQMITLEFDNGLVGSVALMPTPIPDNEAVEAAECNYIWQDAVKVAEKHQAHLMISVVGDTLTAVEVATLCTKLTAVALKQDNALGAYTGSTVFSPHFYTNVAEMMKNGQMPIPNWVYFGLYKTPRGLCGYTVGLADFGYDEIEVLYVKAQPMEVRNFMLDIAYYVITNDVMFHDGETIGFEDGQCLKITKSEGLALNKPTLKIEYPKR